MYKYRYAVRERRATITLDGSGISLELVGPKAAWFLRSLVRDANSGGDMTSFYSEIKQIVKQLREGSQNYQEMLDSLTEKGLEEEDAQKILDILMKQVEEELDDEENAN